VAVFQSLLAALPCLAIRFGNLKVRFLCGFVILICKGEIFMLNWEFLCGFLFLICRGEIFMWICVSYLQG
jgi:hypothetical protein